MDVLEVLVGEELNAVAFVMDYVELHFNGSILRCVSDPAVIVAGTKWQFPDEGSRDALCGLIGSQLAAVTIEDRRVATFRFKSGASVAVPLDDGGRHGGEAMHFVPGLNEPVSVW